MNPSCQPTRFSASMALDSVGALEARTAASVDTASSKPQQGVQHPDASSPTHSRQQDLSTGSFMLDELALPFCSLPEAFDAGECLCFVASHVCGATLSDGVSKQHHMLASEYGAVGMLAHAII